MAAMAGEQECTSGSAASASAIFRIRSAQWQCGAISVARYNFKNYCLKTLHFILFNGPSPIEKYKM
jgi:hypothetical protein